MSDLKRFLLKNSYQKYVVGDQNINYIEIEKLGLFFWERGGKQFADDVLEHEKTMNEKLNDFPLVCSEAEFYSDGEYEETTGNQINSKIVLHAQAFLNALACLGEDKIKELIKGVEE